MDRQNFKDQTFDTMPEIVLCSNFTNCTFNAETTFDKCNLKGCTFNEECKFIKCNISNE